jgi:hypothetical protein
MGGQAGMGEGLEPAGPPKLIEQKLNQVSLFL